MVRLPNLLCSIIWFDCFPTNSSCQLIFLSPQDKRIEQERVTQQVSGGCCALAVVYLLGKFYVANAGDSR